VSAGLTGGRKTRALRAAQTRPRELGRVFDLALEAAVATGHGDLCSELGNDSTGHGRPAAHPQQLMFGDGRNRAAKHT
jgi:hypothetical protein